MVEKTQENTTFVINETLKPNSFEFRYLNSAGTQVKIYYDNPNELVEHLKEMAKLSPEILKNIKIIKEIMGDFE